MMKRFSLKGKGLKFDTAMDVETYLRDLAAISITPDPRIPKDTKPVTQKYYLASMAVLCNNHNE